MAWSGAAREVRPPPGLDKYTWEAKQEVEHWTKLAQETKQESEYWTEFAPETKQESEHWKQLAQETKQESEHWTEFAQETKQESEYWQQLAQESEHGKEFEWVGKERDELADAAVQALVQTQGALHFFCQDEICALSATNYEVRALVCSALTDMADARYRYGDIAAVGNYRRKFRDAMVHKILQQEMRLAFIAGRRQQEARALLNTCWHAWFVWWIEEAPE